MKIERSILLAACVAGCLLLASAGPAWAHDETGVAGGFLSGVRHPVLGFDHLLAMVAVGLWGARLGRPLMINLPLLFPAIMVVGGLLGLLEVPLPSVELGIALSVVLLGTAVAAAYRPPAWVAYALVGVFGLFHGYAHGQELPAAASPAAYGLGFVTATGLLHGVGIALGLLRGRFGERVTRTIGAAIALAGLYFLYAAVAP